jgi:predicted metalloendopeptidase
MYHDDPEAANTSHIEHMELIQSSTQHQQQRPCLKHCKQAIFPSSCKEAILTLSCASLFIVILVLSILLHLSTTTTTALCETPACVHLANTLLSNMDQSVDPCDDFYEYTCGNWNKQNPIPDDRSRYSTFTQLYEQNEKILRRILDSKATTTKATPTKATPTTAPTPTPTATDKAVHFYTSCMDEATIETLGAGPIDDLIAQTHWTPTNGLSQPFDATAAGEGSDRMKLSQAMSVLWQHNINPFVDAGVGADDKHSTQNMLFVGQSGLSLPDRSYYMEDDGNKKDATQDQNMLALQQYMVDLLVLYEKNGDTASVQQRALALVLFEQRLAEQMVSKTILRDPQLAYNVVNVQNDLDAHQTMHWTTFLNLICNTGGQQQCKVPTTVIASSVDYLQGMDTVLRSTESGIVLDYLKWNVLQSLSHHLSLPYQDIRFAFSKQVYGVKSQPARWKTCVSRTNSAVGFALGQLYVEETFGGDSRATALEMIGDIRKWVVWRWWW